MKKNSGVQFQFQPFSKKQKKLLSWWHDSSPHKDCDMIIADGAIRSGKTIAMIMSFLVYTINNFQNQNFIVAGKSIGSVKRNVLEPMFQILNALNIKFTYIRSENPHITIGTNTYYIFGASNEASQDTLQGLTASSALLDEVALFPKNFVDQTIGRCSVEGSKIFMNCNPSSPYHWLKTEFIDKADEKNILHLQFELDDNLSLSEQTKDKYKRMFSGVFYKRYIQGLWTLADGLVYESFTDEMIVDEIPRIQRYYVACDYGSQNPTAFVLIGIGFDNRFYIIDEYYHSGRESGRQKSPTQYAEDLKQFINRKDTTIQQIWIDPSATSFILTCYHAGIDRIAQAVNDVELGIGLINNLINQDLFRVHRRCTNTLKELSTYSWDERSQKLGIDKPMKTSDHLLDAVRYCANGTRTFWNKIIK